MEHTSSDSAHGEEERGLRSKLRRLFGRSKGRHASSSEEYWIPEDVPDYRPPEPQWTLPTPTYESLRRAESHGFVTAASIDTTEVPRSAYQVVPPGPEAPVPQVSAPQVLAPQAPAAQVPAPQVPPPQMLPSQAPAPQVPAPQAPAPQAPAASTGFESPPSWEAAAGGVPGFGEQGLSQTDAFASGVSASSVSPSSVVPSSVSPPSVSPLARAAPSSSAEQVDQTRPSVAPSGEGLESKLPPEHATGQTAGEASVADSGVTIVEKSTEPLGGYLADLDLETEAGHPSPPVTPTDDYRYAQAPDRPTLEKIYLPSEPPEPVPGTAEAFESVEQPAPPEPPPPPPIAVARSTGDYTSDAASVAGSVVGEEGEVTDTGRPGSFGKKRVGPAAFAAEPDVRHVVLGFKDGTAVFLEPEHPLFSLFFQWSELVAGPETPPKMYARREAQRKYYLSKPGRRAKGSDS